ncbi:MAG TPA: hypothetical protein VIL99_16800 [Ignavibacteria bacterium]
MKIKIKVIDVSEIQVVELEIEEAHEKAMGTERRFSGEVYDKNGEPVELSIWEYPEGAVNYIEKSDKIQTTEEDIKQQFLEQLNE